MILFKVEDKLGNTVSLTAERWNQILKHRVPENPELLEEALRYPESVIQSRQKEQTNIYYLEHGKAFLAVVVQEEEGFIKTAYKTKNKKQGERIWKE